jgi:hypothetical protein
LRAQRLCHRAPRRTRFTRRIVYPCAIPPRIAAAVVPNPKEPVVSEPSSAQAFIDKWNGVEASELSTSQSFLLDLCRLLGVDAPHPTAEQDYMFERPITFVHGDGSTSAGRIDLYRRGAFVLESKKLRGPVQSRGFDEAMLRARSGRRLCARAAGVGRAAAIRRRRRRRPPHRAVFGILAFRRHLHAVSRSAQPSHRAGRPRQARRPRTPASRLERSALARPSREAARVTREIAARLAELARSLETARHAPELVAQFLMRCLFTMFAEDVGLLPTDAFRDLLDKHRDKPDVAMRMLGQLWRDMDSGGFSAAIASDVLRFNGKLFKTPDTLPLDSAQIVLLVEAARAKWEHVEPAIFGTLLERALDPRERHKLGAHYTPRAYVERLVLPTVIEPLRGEWSDAQAAALTLAAEGRHDEAVKTLRAFHHRLCNVRVLDPACGSGNFLYVTLEHLKRLEGEVLNALDELGFRQTGLALAGERADAQAGETVDPHNLLGIELNPRAAAIAEVVLWIGYLQWHYRTRGDVNPPIPVVRDFRNIECRDAVLAYDDVQFVADERGVPVTRWDGVTTKPSPVTGEPIPDETARVPLERYVNPRKAAWPQADFVVGNPPFIGTKRMKAVLGDGYVEALRNVWDDVPESADFVMYWWHHAALLARASALRRFGFITTNSIRQAFNRRVIEAAMAPPEPTKKPEPYRPPPGFAVSLDFTEPQRRHPGFAVPLEFGKAPLTLVFAIPDHPWVDTADGAAVRIAMTVVAQSNQLGELVHVDSESEGADEIRVTLSRRIGNIQADLRVGPAVMAAVPLLSNRGISGMGVALHGSGFLLEPNEAAKIRLGGASVVKRFLSGRDVMQDPRERYVIDFSGLDELTARDRNPYAYQHIFAHVKPERDQNKRKSIRELWWRFGWERPLVRAALTNLPRYIATVETSKHRVFVFVQDEMLPEHRLIVFALDDAIWLGAMSSAIHQTWALSAGGTLEDRPVYNKSRCFDPFPFPAATDEQQSRIRILAEQLDAHRKRQQAAHPDLTLTGMYNVLEKLRSDEALTAKERAIHEHGLVSVLRQLHDDLDAAVLDAYGWFDLLPLLRVAHGNDSPAEGSSREDAKHAFDEAILERLVALNAERAAEEARGLVRWLRPEFQSPQAGAKPEQSEIETAQTPDETLAPTTIVAKPSPWPKETVEQVRAVADLLAVAPSPLSLDDIAARFSARGPWKKRLPQLLDMLVALGRARDEGGRYTAAR